MKRHAQNLGGSELLHSYGMEVEPRMMQVPYKQLPRPPLLVGGKTIEARVEDKQCTCRWNGVLRCTTILLPGPHDMENSAMVEGKELRSFAVVAAADRRLGDREINNVVVRGGAGACAERVHHMPPQSWFEGMFRMARNSKGMRISDNAARSIPDVLVVADGSTVDAVRKSCQKAKSAFGQDPQIIFALLTKGGCFVPRSMEIFSHASQQAPSTSTSSARATAACRSPRSAWTWKRLASSTPAGTTVCQADSDHHRRTGRRAPTTKSCSTK